MTGESQGKFQPSFRSHLFFKLHVLFLPVISGVFSGGLLSNEGEFCLYLYHHLRVFSIGNVRSGGNLMIGQENSVGH